MKRRTRWSIGKKKKFFFMLLMLLLTLSASAVLLQGRLHPDGTVPSILYPTSVVLPPPVKEGEREAALQAVPPYKEGLTPRIRLIHDGVPFFTEEEKKHLTGFHYSSLDALGRNGVCEARLTKESMPTEERGKIGMIRPSGMKGNNHKYDFIDGKFIYNRCHIIGYQLGGENADPRNLMTGTRSFNTYEGMLPYENHIAEFLRKGGGDVLYRVTPDFHGNELVARGILLEAWSVKDGGEGISTCVYIYNVEKGVVIDYATGANHAEGEKP